MSQKVNVFSEHDGGRGMGDKWNESIFSLGAFRKPYLLMGLLFPPYLVFPNVYFIISNKIK